MDLFGLMMLVYAGLYIFAVIYLLVKIFAIIKENNETKARIEKAQEAQIKALNEAMDFMIENAMKRKNENP